MQSILLDDWMTSPEMPFNSKITEHSDDIYHSHPFYEIFYILDGSILHDLNGDITTLTTGDMVFLNPKDVHSFLREKGNTCKHRDIVIRKEFFDSITNFIGNDFHSGYNENYLPKHVTITFEEIQQYERRVSNIIITSNMYPELKNSLVRTLCVSMLNRLLEKQSTDTPQRYPIWFEELLSRFHMNDFLNEGLDAILEPFNFDKAYVCRTFKKYIGSTMTDYLNEIRIRNAASLLQYTDKTILSIANEIGFSSVSYFNSVFKKQYHTSPKAFRKQRTLRKVLE